MAKITWIDKNKDGTGEETIFRDTDANEVKASLHVPCDTAGSRQIYVK